MFGKLVTVTMLERLVELLDCTMQLHPKHEKITQFE
jgi:hypothetical protein